MVTGHFTTPPPEGIIYAPMDIAVEISEGLTKRGHLVDFYGPQGTNVKVNKVISDGLKALNQPEGEAIKKGPNVGNAEINKIFNLWDQYLIAQMYKAAENGEYDLLHIHPVDRALPLALSHPKIPTVYTLHDPIYPWRGDIFRLFSTPNQYYISISDAQRKPAPDLNYLATIYNGIDLNLFPFSETAEDFFLFVGRITPEKGVAEAIEAARIADVNLVIVGPPITGPYWEERIRPYLGEKIKYVGHVPYRELCQYYQKARAILVPIQWEEPFGLVMIESMACGTPVIAFRRGSVPEVIKDKKTGFIVENVNEMAEAIKKIESIKRKNCREHVEKNFGIDKMIDSYEKEFLRLTK